jgi:hypothetical protein
MRMQGGSDRRWAGGRPAISTHAMPDARAGTIMVTYEYGDIVFECDGCSELLETGTGNWEAGQSCLHQQGWKAVSVGEGWEHICPGCRRERGG